MSQKIRYAKMTFTGDCKNIFCCKWCKYLFMLTSIFISRQHVHRKVCDTQRYLSKCCILSKDINFSMVTCTVLDDKILPFLQKFFWYSLLILNCISPVSTNLSPVCVLTTHRPVFFSQCLLVPTKSLFCFWWLPMDNQPLPYANMVKNPTHTPYWQPPERFLSHS